MDLVLASMPLPVRLTPEIPLSDGELMRFSRENRPLRMERDAKGEIIVMSPVGSEGGSLEGEVVAELFVWARADGRGKGFGPSAGFLLPDGSVRAADAAWVSLGRWNGLTEAERKGFAPLCPEFVIEMRSESDDLAVLRAKMEMWMENGTEVSWLIDPKERRVEVYRVGEGAEVLVEPSSVEGSGCVEGFCLVMSRVWGSSR